MTHTNKDSKEKSETDKTTDSKLMDHSSRQFGIINWSWKNKKTWKKYLIKESN
ncbi:hypothetical protein HYE26_03965 [Mycoplasmopsis bovis]|nr:hypothetical protein HYE26_03965 [Mycoplasmopsis bovis]